MDTAQSSSTRTPACSLLSTVPLVDTISCDFPLVWSVPKTSSRKDGPDPRRVPRMYQNHRWHHHTWPHWGRTWHPPMRSLMQIAHKYDLVFNPQKTHVKAQAINFFGCLYNANGVHLDPGKVDAVHALPAPTNVTELQEFLGLVTYLSPFIPGLSTLTAPLWELLKKDTNFSWNCTYNTILSGSRKPSSVTSPSGTSTHHYLWQSKLMPHR